MEVKLTDNIKYFPGLSKDALKWLKDAKDYLVCELSHNNHDNKKDELLNKFFDLKIEPPKGLKFAPRISGDEIVSFDIVKDYNNKKMIERKFNKEHENY